MTHKVICFESNWIYGCETKCAYKTRWISFAKKVPNNHCINNVCIHTLLTSNTESLLFYSNFEFVFVIKWKSSRVPKLKIYLLLGLDVEIMISLQNPQNCASPIFFLDDMLRCKFMNYLYRHIDLVNMLVFYLNFKTCN